MSIVDTHLRPSSGPGIQRDRFGRQTTFAADRRGITGQFGERAMSDGDAKVCRSYPRPANQATSPARYSMTRFGGSSSAAGYCGRIAASVSARMLATATLRNHFLLAGMTYHGACFVDVRVRASSNAAW